MGILSKSISILAAILLLAGCGPTAEEQRVADQQKCSGFGFQPGTESFANCMMGVDSQREAEKAADSRAAQDRAATDQRFQNALKAAKDKADQDAWDRKTGQGAYSSSSNFGAFPTTSGAATFPTTGMNCTTTINSSGSANSQASTSVTKCSN